MPAMPPPTITTSAELSVIVWNPVKVDETGQPRLTVVMQVEYPPFQS